MPLADSPSGGAGRGTPDPIIECPGEKVNSTPRTPIVDKGIGTKALGLGIAWGLALSTHPGIRASPVGLPDLLP